jgi:hypothetical protein
MGSLPLIGPLRGNIPLTGVHFSALLAPVTVCLHGAKNWQLVAVEGASHTYHLIDYDKRVVTAAVPAQSLADVRTSNPDGTVRVTVSSLDSTTGQMKVTTDASQVLVLAMPREELRRMRIGDTFTLVVPQHSRVAGSR